MNKKAMESAVGRQFKKLRTSLDERGRREYAATEAEKVGYGGVSLVSRATGLARSTIYRGAREVPALEATEPVGERPPPEGEAAKEPQGKRRIRRPGAGRKRLEVVDPTLRNDLESLVAPVTRGDPESPLRWSAKGVSRLTEELRRQGHSVGPTKVRLLLRSMGYSLQANRKTKEGSNHPDRDAQFQYINEQVQAQLESGNPAISVDAKKKELVGQFKNSGREWQPKGTPEHVQAHDFPDQALGKVTPYGLYEIGENKGWVSVGVTHDTAGLACGTIWRWWWGVGDLRYPAATELLITGDCGGSNGYRLRLWKLELQHLANAFAIPITVCHLPPGTSKWNKIEHRLFSFISINWRAKPLVSYQVIVDLIAATSTKTGLTVHCELDETEYETGRRVSDEDFAAINLLRHDFHGDWNYTIYPSDIAPPAHYPAKRKVID
jgi:hypothetical protein